MIPLAAAGRQPLFFFGTLMDVEVLACVLARPVDEAELAPARLAGFRRERALHGSYPVLVPCPGAVLEGRLLRRVSRRDIARINHYESDEYRAELRTVVDRRGAPSPAWLFRGLDHLRTAGEAWDLAAWQQRHKRDLIAACAGWMADCAAPG